MLPQLGTSPHGKRLQRIRQSPHWKDGQFQNLSHTPTFANGSNICKVLKDYFLGRHKDNKPHTPIPIIRTNLQQLPVDEDVMIWFGHSSYLLSLAGKTFLVDPVFSGHASPLPNGIKAFPGTNYYQAEHLPPIDFLILTHDHYDHLDYQTICKLKGQTERFICPLGVGAHLEKWGVAPENILEGDWHDGFLLHPGFHITLLPARHFSGRGLRRNKTLWASFLLQSPDLKLYLGGDSGYDTHYAEIGKTYGPVDLAILDNGQYNTAWQYIHELPHESLQAARDLKAKRTFPVHNSKFALALHAWYEPLNRITAANQQLAEPLDLITPQIGEMVFLQDKSQLFRQWWQPFH